jgi:hypothetical protein
MGLFRNFGTGLVRLLFPAILLSASAQAAGTIQTPSGLTVSVHPNGTYEVTLLKPAWQFAGAIGVPLANIASANGLDSIGTYCEISFDFVSDIARHAAIRAYLNQRAVLFSLTSGADSANTFSFPVFSRYPANLNHVTFAGMFGWPTFYGFANESPWAFFDSSSETFILSPAANFMTAHTSFGPLNELTSGISPLIAVIPRGFTHRTMLVVGEGINQTFDTWGMALTNLSGKQRPPNDADVTLNQVGYWTDNGATYYYHADPSRSYQDTLSAVKAEFDQKGITLGYVQLDSWFYPKGATADWNDHSGGIYEYAGATQLFGAGLGGFRQNLGAPLMTHARWIDANSPYRQQYRISGNVATDPRYWADIASYLNDNGVATYEQDWLSDQAQADFNLTDPDAFLDNMSAELAKRNIAIQYCMATTRHFLQASRYNNVTSMRTSQDHFDSSRWKEFLYASRLASAVGVWPFTDVFKSTETGNLILATLSAGPVGVGDPMGSLSSRSLLQTARADGVIVKPDVPLGPLDRCYQEEARNAGAPVISSTYSEFNGVRTYYVFSWPQGSDTAATFSLTDLGLTQSAYLYDYASGAGHVANPDDPLTAPFADGWSFLVAAPIGRSGIAVLGDAGHFVGMGKKRVTDFSDDGTVRLTIAFAAGEASRTIHGYSPDAPVVAPAAAPFTGSDAVISDVDYDAATGHFTIELKPGQDGTASIQLSRIAPPATPEPPPPTGPIRGTGGSKGMVVDR